jgi:hypothetical protein
MRAVVKHGKTRKAKRLYRYELELLIAGIFCKFQVRDGGESGWLSVRVFCLWWLRCNCCIGPSNAWPWSDVRDRCPELTSSPCSSQPNRLYEVGIIVISDNEGPWAPDVIHFEQRPSGVWLFAREYPTQGPQSQTEFGSTGIIPL